VIAMVLTLHGIVCHCVDDGNNNRNDILPSCQPLSDKHVDHVQDIEPAYEPGGPSGQSLSLFL